MFAAGDDSLDPHILTAAGVRAKARCGYAPYDHWKRMWTRPGEHVDLMSICGACRTSLAAKA